MQKEIALIQKVVTTEVTRSEIVTFPLYLWDTHCSDYPNPRNDGETYTKITIEENGIFKKVTINKTTKSIGDTEIQITNWNTDIRYSEKFPVTADQFYRCVETSLNAEADFDAMYKEAVHNLIVLNPVAIQTNPI